MHLIKLDAITSTNDYLKELNSKTEVADFTVVTAEFQTAGRGQMGSKWESRPGENLTFSVLTTHGRAESIDIFECNAAVALALASSLERLGIPDISIKWPNDILSGTFKLSGILIENSFKGDGGIVMVAGVGLNVNQLHFEAISQASSMRLRTGIEYRRDAVLEAVLSQMKEQLAFVHEGKAGVVWQGYRDKLFRKDVPSAFELPDGKHFMGIIRDVDATGKLKVELEDGIFKLFGIKEVRLLY